MIGPICDGFRCGQKVKIADKRHALYGRYGFIIAILDRAGYIFRVDLAQGKRPYVVAFTASQLRPVRTIRAKAGK
jgi:hypothetical protein